MIGKRTTRRIAGAAAAALCLGLAGAAAQTVNEKRICLEAEAGKITAPMTLCKSADCSGGAGIEVVEGVNPKVKEGEATPIFKGDCVLTFKVLKAGMYQVYGRAWWMDGCGNSFYLTFDDGDRKTLSDATYKPPRWHWVRGPLIRLSTGTHTLKIGNSEDGARLDQIFLTSDLRYVPVGKEKATLWAVVK